VSKADGGGTSFADLVWKPIVLIEMKKRGENLQRHYRQAFDYWTRLVPNRPRHSEGNSAQDDMLQWKIGAVEIVQLTPDPGNVL
jgi:hypothetical protein